MLFSKYFIYYLSMKHTSKNVNINSKRITKQGVIQVNKFQQDWSARVSNEHVTWQIAQSFLRFH